MNEGLIPRRYAKALYKVAVERKVDERVYVLMQTLVSSFDNTSGLQGVVSNPFVRQYQKEKIIITPVGAGAADTTFADFLKMLAHNKRIDMVNEIAHAYVDIYRQQRNIRKVEVVSAAPLDSAVLGRITSLVERHLHGATMEFTTTVDPALIGGFVINVDNQRLDASVSNQLKELRQSLLN
ncbi:MAG: F0F1 ATP synthase subunit delta [Muribaculaceae bacterium]|nr:F0F1 ATP synthase subunit delta [Muribaculaceae bacterium]